MKAAKKRRRTDACLVLCGVLIWFLADAERVRRAAAEALILCGSSVIPALFPFLAVSALLISLGFGDWVSPHLAGLMALFRLPGSAGSALLLGLAGGYPIGARTAADLYEKGLLTSGEAERLLAFCNNSNPVFLVSVLGAGVFGSVRAGIYLWLIHILSALLAGLFFRGKRKQTAPLRVTRRTPCQELPSLPAALVRAVQGSALSMLSVCAFVVLFYVLAQPLGGLGGELGPALVGLTELFSLTPMLTPSAPGFILASGCAGWGGLSVLCQTAAVLDGSGLRLRNCVLGKALQGALAALLAALVQRFLL